MVDATKAAQGLRFGPTPGYIVVLGAAILIVTIGVQFYASREIYRSEMALSEETTLNRMELKAKDRRMSLLGGLIALEQYYRSSEDVELEDVGIFMGTLHQRHQIYEPVAGWINLDKSSDTNRSAIVGTDGTVTEFDPVKFGPTVNAMVQAMDTQGVTRHLRLGAPFATNADESDVVTVFARVREQGARNYNGIAFTSFNIENLARSLGNSADAEILSIGVLQNGVRTALQNVSNGIAHPNLSSFVLKVADAELEFTVATSRPGMLEWYIRTHLPSLLTQLAVPILLLTMGLITLRHIRIAHAAGRMAENSNFRKTRFLATMSHEMRTPLNGILGMAELMGRSPLTASQTEQLKTLTRSGEALLSHINQILDFSKIEADAFELDIEEADLGRLVADTFRAVNVLAAPRNLPVYVALPLDVPRKIRVDALRLQQVMTNLLSNAIKFTSAGHVMMRISVESHDTESRRARLRFAVEDTGIGISAAKQREIFEAFSQADVSTTRRYGGTGLGLSISQQIVAKMGGEIEVQSTEGQGSTFTFAVDLDLSRETQPRRREFAVAATQNVLIALENATLSKALVNSFERIGGFARHVPDLRSARERLLLAESANDPFDILLTDDVALIAELRGATTHAFKAGWLRGSVESISPAEVTEATAADFVCEAPYLPETLMASIAEAVAHRKFGRQVAEPECSGELYHFPGIRVLLVEDDGVNQMYASALLKERACETVQVENGKEAVDLMLGGEMVDAILLDCQMPIMDGFTAASILKAAMSEGKIARIPIIALTANALKGDRERCLAAGMDDYLSKPLRGADLCDALNRQLPGRGVKAADRQVPTNTERPSDTPIIDAPPAAPEEFAEPASPVLSPAASVSPTNTAVQATANGHPPKTAQKRRSNVPASSDLPIVDATVLATARSVMKDRFARLLGMFCGESPSKIRDMRAMIDRRDYVACSRLGHTMKSSARMLGASRVAYLAARLEDVAGAPDPVQPEIVALVDALETALTDYIVTIRKYAKGGEGSPPLAMAS
ncbi:ATP-binding protein [Palleronia sp. LCG004]|uniref:hybrid sensor histidine kinase/response regulator n=1 Tax=Palleronia sp. LCG004 TaxID=3079304 RepID=UPI0029423B58|nr:ATP-binding protein [Palleronia sp. LCG004]WOI56217.1 ATP-binding protein [Palleronia sp. LCG004]